MAIVKQEMTKEVAKTYIMSGLEKSNRAASLEELLRMMPSVWCNDRSNLYEDLYSENMVQTVFDAVDELVVEGRLELTQVLVLLGYISSIGGGESIKQGRREFGVRISK